MLKERQSLPSMARALAGVLMLIMWAGIISCDQPGSGNFANEASLRQVDSVDDYGYQHRFFRDTAGSLTGAYERRVPGGQRIEEAFYRQGLLDSARVLFYESTGDTQIVEHYRQGRFEGEYRYYYENGQLQLVGNYVAGKMEGQWRKYYEDGALMEVVTFQDNQENGPFVEYHPNGKLKAEGMYQDGDFEHGELKLYDEEGRLMRTMQCEKGICRTTWVAAEANG